MPQYRTEEILKSLEAGEPLPDYRDMDFAVQSEVIAELAGRIDRMPDWEKVKKQLEKEKSLAKKEDRLFDEKEERKKLEKTCLISRNKFAEKANISPSHLTQFLNSSVTGTKKKGMSRDRLLSIFITLDMNILEINEWLKKFDGIDTLHASRKRDYLIMVGIEQHLELDEIDQLLREHKIEGLDNFT